MTETLRALGVLAEPPTPARARIAHALGLPGEPDAVSYADLFLFQVYPYASVYLGAEGMLGGEARDRVAGFWRALGLVPPAEPDHLAALLGLAAALGEAERAEEDGARRALRREARRALLWEHLLPWLPPFLTKVEELDGGFYGAWASLLRTVLREDVEALGVPRTLPLHLRTAPALEPPQDVGGEAFLSAMLAPVRSGFVLTRDDLRRAAEELGLGARVAERRYVLRGLIAQDGAGLLGWLAAEARRWCSLHARDEVPTGIIGVFWQERVSAAAGLLDEAAELAAADSEVAHA